MKSLSSDDTILSSSMIPLLKHIRVDLVLK